MSYAQPSLMPSFTRPPSRVAIVRSAGYDRDLGALIFAALHEFDLPVRGMAHITGGGFYDNLPRVLPKTVAAHVNFGSWPVAPVFQWLKKQGELSWPEMLQIFNTGIGFVLIAKKDATNDIMDRLAAMDTPGYVIGEIHPRKDDQEQVQVHFPEA